MSEPRYWMQQIRRSGRLQSGQPSELEAVDRVPPPGISRPGGPQKVKGPKLSTDWSEDLGSAAKVGAGNYPAKFAFFTSSNGIITASCTSDFTVFNMGLAGSATQASIIAYNNIYSGCTGTVPQVYWAYNTGGTIETSVVLSGDGSQVAFVHSSAGGASLVVLRWAATGGSYSSPTSPTSETPANYPGCTAPCMTSITFSGSPNDTTSSPYYDYLHDVIYVGDATTPTAKLHKFTPVFNGTPAEVTSSPWPLSMPTAYCATTGPLTSPVQDPTTGDVFVGDAGGCLDYVTATAATPAATQSASDGSSPGVNDAPLVDSSAETEYIFVPNHTGRNRVYQYTSGFASGAAGTAHVSTGTNGTTPFYAGAFDNEYFTSSSSSSPTGHLYVCGDTGGDPILYQIAITSNTMGTTAVTGPTLTTAATTCSPVTEFCNPGTGTCANTPTGNAADYIFLSVQADASTSRASSCTTASSGCVMAFNVTSGTITTTTNAASDANEAGGTSGIIIDNSVGAGTLAGASQVYFSTLANGTSACATSGGTGGCAVQASQSAL